MKQLARSMLVLLAALGATATHAADVLVPWRAAPRAAAPTDRVIVKWRTRGLGATPLADVGSRTQRLAAASGVQLAPVRTLVDRLDVMRMPTALGGSSLRRVVQQLATDPAVEYVEADERRYVLAAPNDPRYAAGSDAVGSWQGQWYLNDPDATQPAATGATTAAASFTGQGFIIAVLDTGVDTTHPDLGVYNASTNTAGKLLPGYDFICNDTGSNCYSTSAANTYNVANDGNGWDADATDPGDWLTAADIGAGGPFHNQGCGGGDNHDQPLDSSWHGTRVAGIAAAMTNNGVGIAGTAPGAYVLPVRVLGKCNGYLSDIVAGMYWAAGMSYSGLSGAPANAYPAQVLNLSLGAQAACTQTEQDAVTAITNAGHLVVAAAGNEGGPVDAPASCAGVLSVAGIRHVGTKVGYSNVSSTAAAITIAAPAGNCVNVNASHPYALPCLYSIETTTNEGKTVPGASGYTYAQVNAGYAGSSLNEGSVGTSFATPIVSGVAAMMIQANPQISAAQLVARMKAGATPFPVPATTPAAGACHVAALTTDGSGKYTDLQAAECTCTTATCGAGMLDARGAINQALKPVAGIKASETVASPGDHITLEASPSAAGTGRTLIGWQWSNDLGAAIGNANTATATVVFPALRPMTVTLVVTDDHGATDTTTLLIDSHLGTSSKGGGGWLAPWELAALALAALVAFARRRRARRRRN